MSKLLVYIARTIVVQGNVPTLSKTHFPLSKSSASKKKKKKKKCVGACSRLGVLFRWALYRKHKSPNTRPVAR